MSWMYDVGIEYSKTVLIKYVNLSLLLIIIPAARKLLFDRLYIQLK